MNIADVIDRYAATRAMAPALIEGARTVTWAEYADLVRRTAAHLRAQGVRPGDTVGLNLKDNLGHVIAMTAVARLGARFLPLDWRARPAERQRLIEGFAASLVLTEADAPAPAGVAALPLDDRWQAAVARAPLDQDFPHDGDAPMFIAVSSGTTGRPKGAIASHTLFRQRLAKYSVSFGLCRGHRYLSVTPLCHAAGWHYLYYALVGGSPVILHPTLFSAEEYVAAASRHEASFALLVPTVLRWLLQLPGGKTPLLPTLRILVASADVMHADEKRAAIARICPHFYESYSSSATGTLSVLPPEEVAARAESVGFPNLLTELQIVDEEDRPLPAGAVGRIRVRGPGISSGYCGAGAEVETAQRLPRRLVLHGRARRARPSGFPLPQGPRLQYHPARRAHALPRGDRARARDPSGGRRGGGRRPAASGARRGGRRGDRPEEPARARRAAGVLPQPPAGRQGAGADRRHRRAAALAGRQAAAHRGRRARRPAAGARRLIRHRGVLR